MEDDLAKPWEKGENSMSESNKEIKLTMDELRTIRYWGDVVRDEGMWDKEDDDILMKIQDFLWENEQEDGET